MAGKPIPLFTADVLRGIADVLGATDDGLTESEITHNLAQVRVLDVNPGIASVTDCSTHYLNGKTRIGSATAWWRS